MTIVKYRVFRFLLFDLSQQRNNVNIVRTYAIVIGIATLREAAPRLPYVAMR
jgi:hypothetical protein